MRKVDILYSYLRKAQENSDNAKNVNIDWTRGSDYDNQCKRDRLVSSFYEKKEEYIIKALKRARKLNIPTFYNWKSNIVYFELDKGQVSFHEYGIDIDLLEEITTVVEEYQWSGKLGESRYIVNSYFE